MKYRLILASASPRRRELLEQVGAEFEILPAQGKEIIAGRNPRQIVMELSSQKADEIAEKIEDEQIVILGADTVVAYEGQILGKPRDERDAKRMLELLSGNTHSVFTGVTMIIIHKDRKETCSFVEETRVTMYPMKEQQILSYIRTGEPLDKAGAYAIQGKCARYIQGIQGDYYNVVGLPLGRIFHEMEQSGIEI
ncbi:MAG: septum formation protein Maf [Lachnospiraceae bacterium]|nr:septum formation protein Maf [Lachnospiraceae bacterium]